MDASSSALKSQSGSLGRALSDGAGLSMRPVLLTFRVPGVEGAYLAEVAKSRLPVLVFIFCFDCCCYLFRFVAKVVNVHLLQGQAGLVEGSMDIIRDLGPQLANMALLWIFIGLLNRRSRTHGDSAARQEEVLLSTCMAIAICNLLASLGPDTAHEYVYVAFFLICTSSFLKIRWWVGTLILATPTALANFWQRGKRLELLPQDAVIHILVAWAVGGLMAYLAEWYRRQVFSSQHLAQAAHEKELLEAQARIRVQRQLAAAQAQAAQRALSVAREKAANEAKSEFMSLMCHEVRTPLNGCLASAEMLLETELDDEQRELANTIRVSGSILLSTVSNFLDFFKMEAGKALDIVRSDVDLVQLVSDVHCIIDAMVGRSGEVRLLHPQLSVSSDLQHIVCDPDRVRGILLNLYTNAAKFTKAGHIGLKVQEVGDEYQPSPDPGYYSITVTPAYQPRQQQLQLQQQQKAGAAAASKDAQAAAGRTAEGAGADSNMVSAPATAATAAATANSNPHLSTVHEDTAMSVDVTEAVSEAASLRDKHGAAALTTKALEAIELVKAGSRGGVDTRVVVVCDGSNTLRSGEYTPPDRQSSVEEEEAEALSASPTASSTRAGGAWPVGKDSQPAPRSSDSVSAQDSQQGSSSSLHKVAVANAHVQPSTAAGGSRQGAAGSFTATTPSGAAQKSPAPPQRWLLFEVMDTGIGIAQAGLSTLFKEYVQGTDDEMKKPRSKGGTGLGLSICSKQVAVLGGRIGAYSAPGQGSVFWFTVPITVAPEREALLSTQSNVMTTHSTFLSPPASPLASQLASQEFLQLAQQQQQQAVHAQQQQVQQQQAVHTQQATHLTQTQQGAMRPLQDEPEGSLAIHQQQRALQQQLDTQPGSPASQATGPSNGGLASVLSATPAPGAYTPGSGTPMSVPSSPMHVDGAADHAGAAFAADAAHGIVGAGAPAAGQPVRTSQQGWMTLRPGLLQGAQSTTVLESGAKGQVQQSGGTPNPGVGGLGQLPPQAVVAGVTGSTGADSAASDMVYALSSEASVSGRFTPVNTQATQQVDSSWLSSSSASLGPPLQQQPQPQGLGSSCLGTDGSREEALGGGSSRFLMDLSSSRLGSVVQGTASNSLESFHGLTRGVVNSTAQTGGAARGTSGSTAAASSGSSSGGAQMYGLALHALTPPTSVKSSLSPNSSMPAGVPCVMQSSGSGTGHSYPSQHMARMRGSIDVGELALQQQRVALAADMPGSGAAAAAGGRAEGLLACEVPTLGHLLAPQQQQQQSDVTPQLTMSQLSQLPLPPVRVGTGRAASMDLGCVPPHFKMNLSQPPLSQLLQQRLLASSGNNMSHLPQGIKLGPDGSPTNGSARPVDMGMGYYTPVGASCAPSGHSTAINGGTSLSEMSMLRGDALSSTFQSSMPVNAGLGTDSMQASSLGLHGTHNSMSAAGLTASLLSPHGTVLSQHHSAMLAALSPAASLGGGALSLQGSLPGPQGTTGTSPPQVLPHVAALRGRKVLLVEDNLINQTVARKMLAGLGLTCEVASNGLEAVGAVEKAAASEAGSTGCTYDVILMDMMMPVMGGVDATRAIRALGVRTPILAMTANASDKDRDECAAAGMDGFLSKPVLKDRLADAISKVLAVTSAAAAAAAGAPPQ